MSQINILITGGSGGLGSAATLYLAEKGCEVYTVDCDKAVLSKFKGTEKVIPLLMDVTDQTTIDNAFQVISQQTDGLDGIVNFAGVFAPGSLVDISEDTLHHVLNVNVMGMYRVNKTFFPLINERKGRIINISSEVGRQSGAPFAGTYAISKHAVEAYSDSLRRELMVLNVHVIKIQPGPFQTAMTRNLESEFGKAAGESIYFHSLLNELKHIVSEESKKANDPIILAKVIHEALTTPNPKIAYPVMPDRRRELMELLPVRIQDILFARLLKSGNS